MQFGFWKIKRSLCCFCFQGVDFLLLLFCCRIWGRTLCLSTGRTFKPLKSNVAAMTTVTSWKAGSQFQNKESARKPQNSPGFQRLCLSVAVPDKRRNQNEPKAILQTFLFINCCKTISCYFMLFCQRAPYLYRGLAFQVLQLLSMLFSSSSRWGILCLPSKRSFEKSWNIVSRETSNWHELTFNTIWLSFQLLEFGG